MTDSPSHPPPMPLSPLMRPIDLTTDHSAYNPAEVTAVLRRCNNAPRVIPAASGGGIKQVAGSLAVTRALGNAYLKTPRLSFFLYKRHASYITARPENPTSGVAAGLSLDDGNLSGHKCKRGSTTSIETHGSNSSHGRRHRSSIIPPAATVSEVIVRRVLNKVRRAQNISSLRILMSLPKGRPLRSKHDDITASVVDMSGFVS
eukprot:10409837-Ditylum_brightwellii.AAC.1